MVYIYFFNITKTELSYSTILFYFILSTLHFVVVVNTNITYIDIRALSQLKICNWHKQVKPNYYFHIWPKDFHTFFKLFFPQEAKQFMDRIIRLIVPLALAKGVPLHLSITWCRFFFFQTHKHVDKAFMGKMGFCGELRHKAQESISGHMLGIVNELDNFVLFQTHAMDIFFIFFFLSVNNPLWKRSMFNC